LRVWIERLLPLVLGCEEAGSVLSSFLDGLRDVKRMSAEEFRASLDSLTAAERRGLGEVVGSMLQGAEALIAEDVVEEALKRSDDGDGFSEVLAMPEILFMLRVKRSLAGLISAVSEFFGHGCRWPGAVGGRCPARGADDYQPPRKGEKGRVLVVRK
jgi:hypothetical protein